MNIVLLELEWFDINFFACDLSAVTNILTKKQNMNNLFRFLSVLTEINKN